MKNPAGGRGRGRDHAAVPEGAPTAADFARQSRLLQEALEQLRLSEDRFHGLLNATAAGMAVSDPRGRYLQTNAAYCQMLGYTPEEMLTRDFASLTHPDDLELNLAMFGELLAGDRDSMVMEKRYIKKGGDIQWARVSVAPGRAISGEITTLTIVAEDIDERKRAELRLNRLNRLHTVQSKIGEAIVRTRDRQRLYDQVCRIVVEHGLLRMAFIAEVDAEAQQARPAASHGAGLEYLREPAASEFPADGPLSWGTVGTAIHTGVYDVCNDIAGEARMAPWREAAMNSGLLANASFPLTLNGAIVAVLVLYAGETNYFLDDEIALMVSVADTLSFALDALDKEQQRQRADLLSRHLAAIVESSDDAIIGKDLNGVVTSWNRGAEKIFGYTAVERVGTSLMRLLPPGRPDEENQILEKIRRGQSLENFETQRLAKDGRHIFVSVTASPIRNSDGAVIGVSEVAHDITRTKTSETRFRRLVDSNLQGVFFWNRKGEIWGANDAFLKLVRYTRQDMEAGRINWQAMTPPEYVDRDNQALREIAAAGVCKVYEKEYIRADGSRVPILLGSAVFEDNADEGVCFVLDLTEQKRLEQQFRQIQKMEGIGALAGGVAHDLNNILAVIQMQADFLRFGGDISAIQQESADDIIAAVERAAAITRQLLLFSSREVFRPQEIDLSESISGTLKMLARIVGEDIQMTLKVAPQPMFIHADPAMLDQVLLNLVVNARDAMPDGGRIVIETFGVELDDFAASQSAQARAGSFVCLSVSDSGPGISSDILPNIFEPFFTTKDVGKGTGLGLATVFGIVRQHEGWVNAYSEIGHGATFRIYIPRLAQGSGQAPPRPEPEAIPRGHETILLVEDEPVLRAAAQKALAQLGYRVLEAASGARALEIWSEHRKDIQLLLTDLVMPGGMTGKDLAERVLADSPGLKVIYISGYSVEVLGKDWPMMEGVNFLSKPFQARKLAQTVRNCLDRD